MPQIQLHQGDYSHRCTFVADMGAAYGTAKSGVAVASLGVMNPQLVMKSMIPVVMAGVIGIYGLIVAVIIVGQIPKQVTSPDYCAKIGYAHFGSGESAQLSHMPVIGKCSVRCNIWA